VGSFYRLKEFFSGERVTIPQYMTIFKYSLLVFMLIGLTVAFAFEIATAKIFWAGD
jgi:hypothetical protein